MVFGDVRVLMLAFEESERRFNNADRFPGDGLSLDGAIPFVFSCTKNQFRRPIEGKSN
jgi:hypothetical protein